VFSEFAVSVRYLELYNTLDVKHWINLLIELLSV